MSVITQAPSTADASGVTMTVSRSSKAGKSDPIT